MKKKILGIVLCLMFIGCSHHSSNENQISDIQTGVGKLQVYVEGAQGNVKQAIPHTDATGKIYLNNASDNLTGASKEIATTQSEISKAQKLASERQTQIDKQELQLQQYHNQWIGDATWRAWYWILGIWAVVGIAATVVSVFFPVGILGKLAIQVLHLLPFSNIFQMFVKKSQDVNITVNTPAIA